MTPSIPTQCSLALGWGPIGRGVGRGGGVTSLVTYTGLWCAIRVVFTGRCVQIAASVTTDGCEKTVSSPAEQMKKSIVDHADQRWVMQVLRCGLRR